MAIYNEILTPRFARMLQKLFGIKGEVPAKQLSGEFGAVIPIFSGVENRYLEQWNRFGIAVNAPAVAAANSAVRLRNPVGSNVVIVIEKLLNAPTTAADTPVLQQNNTPAADLATIVSALRFDARSQVTTSSVGSVGILSVNAAGGVSSIGGTIMQYALPAASNVDLILTDDQELTLLPGDLMQLLGGTNIAVRLSLIWRERFLEEPERF